MEFKRLPVVPRVPVVPIVAKTVWWSISERLSRWRIPMLTVQSKMLRCLEEVGLELVSCKKRDLLVPAELLHYLSGPTMGLTCWNRRPVART